MDYYAPAIYRWCVRRGLQDTDAQDVTQQVLLQLATKLPAFTYDPARSFRAWLRTLRQRCRSGQCTIRQMA